MLNVKERFATKNAILLLLILLMVVAWYTWLNEYLTFDNLKENRTILYSFVEDHYFSSVIIFIAIVVTTGFFVPAAIPMILVGGFLFGIFWGTIYVNLGFTVGATLAFLLSRYVIGNWIQHRYGDQLRSFNDEVTRFGRWNASSFGGIYVCRPGDRTHRVAERHNVGEISDCDTAFGPFCASACSAPLFSTAKGQAVGLTSSIKFYRKLLLSTFSFNSRGLVIK
jgi:hypothetical protein